MWWKIILEVIIVLGLLATGGPFWVCARARSHFYRFMRDQSALKQMFEHVDRDTVISAASAIEPIFGSYAGNIVALDRVHFRVMRKTRNLTFVAVIILLAISYWISSWFFAANVVIFLLLGIGDLSGYAKSNSGNHAHELISNIYKWNQVSSKDCFEYCCHKYPILANLYHSVSALSSQKASTP